MCVCVCEESGGGNYLVNACPKKFKGFMALRLFSLKEKFTF
jgi:hypothetical protein